MCIRDRSNLGQVWNQFSRNGRYAGREKIANMCRFYRQTETKAKQRASKKLYHKDFADVKDVKFSGNVMVMD